MQTYLQFGYGMIGHAEELLSSGCAKGVILSPRDLEPGQLKKVSKSIADAGGEVLFDPQCFLRDSDHKRLVSHKFWQAYKDASTSQILGADGATKTLKELLTIDSEMGCEKHILPGVLAKPVSDAWFAFQESIVNEAVKLFSKGNLFPTIALSVDSIANESELEAVIERASRWPVAGFYVTAQAPEYLVENPNWLGNLLIFLAGLRLLKKEVLVGYCNHQMLCLAASNVDFIASGTWLNVRSFDPDKFYKPEEESKSRRALWYYCPQALSEFKLTFLDVAQRGGILQQMSPVPESPYAAPLFSGAVPSAVNWGEQNAFRHYLCCLNQQVVDARKANFEATINHQFAMLDSAEKFLKKLKMNGVLSQERDFSSMFDVNRSALTLLEKARGAQLRRNW